MKPHYGEAYGYAWDLGFVFSDEMPKSKTAKNRDECRERARSKKKNEGGRKWLKVKRYTCPW